MAILIDETGNRHNRWAVLERAENGPLGQARWLCRCDCGTERAVMGTYLRFGLSKSCGCLQRDVVSLPEGEAAFNRVVKAMKYNAKTRGHELSLTKEQMRVLTQQPCHYCGVEPRQVYQSHGCNGVYFYNGLDRVDNEKGYTFDNVVPCCKVCNGAKSATPIDEFAEWVSKVMVHWANEHLK